MPHLDGRRILEELDAQTDTLQASEAELLLQLGQIRTKLTELKSKKADLLNTAIQPYILPDDVFLHIVKIGQELDRDSNNPYCEPFQHLVSRVSRRWKMSVINAPLLWTRIRCTPSQPSALDMLEAFLMRSQRCPLDITFDMSEVIDHS